MLPSLPHRPIARPPWALIVPTICLLIEPASTISTISTVALSVMRRPAEKRDLMPSFVEHRADLRPAAVDDHRIDAGLLEQHHVAGEIAPGGLVAHRVAAVFHDDRRVVVAQHVRQRLHQDFGLLLRAGAGRFGHGLSGGSGGAVLAGGEGNAKRGKRIFRAGGGRAPSRGPSYSLAAVWMAGLKPKRKSRELRQSRTLRVHSARVLMSLSYNG